MGLSGESVADAGDGLDQGRSTGLGGNDVVSRKAKFSPRVPARRHADRTASNNNDSRTMPNLEGRRNTG
ncbi:hypothetical protein G6F61_014106 [Rhizopus arrhizus]|nr:hypothetical protein G6F61_014106 [Rhizopus arrhizus]